MAPEGCSQIEVGNGPIRPTRFAATSLTARQPFGLGAMSLSAKTPNLTASSEPRDENW